MQVVIFLYADIAVHALLQALKPFYHLSRQPNQLLLAA